MKVLCKVFDEEFTNLSNVATSQEHKEYNSKILDNMCANIKSDIETLDVCIKSLRRNLEEGKNIFDKCSLAHLCLQIFDIQVIGKVAEIQVLANNFLQPHH